ncbi:substrate-binding periplasmic protein [Paradevosia shaoguanensis]|uniref:substrate-binding periplasmic protein n=1 Tax=Paradevosia shaoguanensis TaxID=1335043 RepID=UPI003C73C6EF
MSSLKKMRRFLRDIGTAVILFALLAALYLLPPDTSLAQVEQAGVLRVCLPERYPPLVTGDVEKPGFDVELLRAITERMGVRLDLNRNSAMGRDFNPRNWRVTRTQCQMLAGGTVDSSRTRSFLDVTQPYLHTGWALVSPVPLPLDGARLGFYPGLTGLDRIALSRYLKEQKARAKVEQSLDAVGSKIEAGELDGGIGEVLSVTALAVGKAWTIQELPLERYPIVFGLWRGDLTLKRRLEQVMTDLKQDGVVRDIAARYGLEAALE